MSSEECGYGMCAVMHMVVAFIVWLLLLLYCDLVLHHLHVTILVFFAFVFLVVC